MRTTVEIDDDVLELAKSLARYRKQSVGKVISEVFRKGCSDQRLSTKVVNGVRVIARGENAKAVTLDIVNKLRDEI